MTHRRRAHPGHLAERCIHDRTCFPAGIRPLAHVGVGLDHHFVDPMKFCYYAMVCYRTIGADSMAGHLAEEVIEANTDFDGQKRAPVRMAEARITLGIVRAREGDLEGAVGLGMRALEGDRKSL